MPAGSAVLLPPGTTLEHLNDTLEMEEEADGSCFQTPGSTLKQQFSNTSTASSSLLQESDTEAPSFSHRLNTSLSFDVKKFSARLSSHMSAFSDTLFSDIEDMDELGGSQPSSQNSNVDYGGLIPGQEDIKPEYSVTNLVQSHGGSHTLDLQQVQAQHCDLDKGALYQYDRSKTPVPCGVGMSGMANIISEVTPTKPVQELDPITPTANLKVLLSAASPEIRNRERQRLNETGEFDMSDSLYRDTGDGSMLGVQGLEDMLDESMERIISGDKSVRCEPCVAVLEEGFDGDSEMYDGVELRAVSRKDKSLGLLCQRFLSLYPENPSPNERHEICLDGVAEVLAVGRRRIYDIVNVLESVDMVRRVAKNRYSWHGTTKLSALLGRLKTQAITEDLATQLAEMRESESEGRPRSRGHTDNTKENAPRKKPFSDVQPFQELHRKDKSLGLLSQKFLMLFLVSQEPRTINLDLSAKILIGDPNVDKTETGKFKTKIRRLYDIANILTSLNLICKIHVNSNKGRKPAFQYIGPDPDLLPGDLGAVRGGDGAAGRLSHGGPVIREIRINTQKPNHRPEVVIVHPRVTRPIEPKPRAAMCKTQTVPKGIGSASGSTRVVGAKKSLTRHASFEQICQVAEHELEKERSIHNSPRVGSLGVLNSPQWGYSPVRLNAVSESKSVPSHSEPHTSITTAPSGSKTTVVTLTEDQLQAVIHTLSSAPQATKVRLEGGKGTSDSPPVKTSVLLNALKNAKSQPNATAKTAQSLNRGKVTKKVVLVKNAGASNENRTAGASNGNRTTVNFVTSSGNSINVSSGEFKSVIVPGATRTDCVASVFDHQRGRNNIATFSNGVKVKVLQSVKSEPGLYSSNGSTGIPTPVYITHNGKPPLKRLSSESIQYSAGSEVKRVKVEGQVTEYDDNEPLDLSCEAAVTETDSAQCCHSVDSEVAGIYTSKTHPVKSSPTTLRSLNFGDSFSTNHNGPPFLKVPSFGLPKIPSMDCGLPSPLVMDRYGSAPGSALNTPTLPNQDGVFTFPPPASHGAGARSLPTTPTFRLSSTSSPVMLLPPRKGRQLCTDPVQSSSFSATVKTEGNPALVTPGNTMVTPGSTMVTPTSLAFMGGKSPLMDFSTSTPTTQYMTCSGMNLTHTTPTVPYSHLLPGGVNTTYKTTPNTPSNGPFLLPGSANKLLKAVTPLTSGRPSTGIKPTSDKMVNLGSLFAMPYTVTSSHTLDSSPLSPNYVLSGQSEENDMTPGNRGSGLMSVATPGTFFKHTPGPIGLSPNGGDTVTISPGGSAFTSVVPGCVTKIPVRKLTLLPEANRGGR